MSVDSLRERYHRVRNHSLEMVALLREEELYHQAVQEVSPPAWNLGHTNWFFDAVILGRYGGTLGGDGKLWYHFNSYYKGAGRHVRQACRGAVLVHEAPLQGILKYRSDVDEVMDLLLDGDHGEEFDRLVELGINHEQQHQELFYTEVLRNRFEGRAEGRHISGESRAPGSVEIPLRWVPFEETIAEVGNVEGGFGFDNEYGVHRQYIHSFAMMNRPVINGEFLEFIADGGYENFAWWFAEAWDDGSMRPVLRLADREIFPRAPLYWKQIDGMWQRFTLQGWQQTDPHEPVSHLSYFEAAAYATWKSRGEDRIVRLPTEAEWEHAARRTDAMAQVRKNEAVLLGGELYRPAMTPQEGEIKHMMGNVWEWTNSSYLPYPGFRPYPGAIAEYNGKFMSNKMVLKGGSWATPKDHIRISYRNFWPLTFQFAIPGFRLVMES